MGPQRSATSSTFTRNWSRVKKRTSAAGKTAQRRSASLRKPSPGPSLNFAPAVRYRIAGDRAHPPHARLEYPGLRGGHQSRPLAPGPGRDPGGSGDEPAMCCEEGDDLANGGFSGAEFGHRQVGLDLVAVAAAVLMPEHVARLGEIGHDAVGSALGDAQAGRDVAQPHVRVLGDTQQHPGVVGQESPVRHAKSILLFPEKYYWFQFAYVG